MNLPHGAYGRGDVRRMLNVSERQLRSWEKQGFVEACDSYGFPELVALRTLCSLRELKISAATIRKALASLKVKLENIDKPLSELRITVEGRQLAVHVSGSRMEAISGQLLFDFDATEIRRLRSFPLRPEPKAAAEPALEQQSEYWFQRGLALEETGAPPEDARKAYLKAIEANPGAPGALVNLGTIAFRKGKLKEAADYYARAVTADPQYPLAHFNLGNLYDEQGNFAEARKAYLEAARLNPGYADAYFNLALVCERSNDLMQAIRYWQSYLRLDSTSSWAREARKQLDRLKKSVRSK